MKKASLLVLMSLMALTSIAQTYSDSLRAIVLLETSMGNIKIALANETPLHRDNFLKLVKEGAYDGVLFHRVIKDFMIQTGDLGTKNAQKGRKLKETKESYKVPAEIVYPKLFHHRGAVAAAREADSVNPERASSASQFYIVYGWSFNEPEIDLLKHKIDSVSQGKVQMTNEVRQAYLEHGGSPHLDGGYTVFGEVIEGMDVVDKIQRVETDDADRPKEDVRILKATVLL
jgi:peptidyl-prolyl cis-trans isomerase B (cyclophilin B)